MSHENVTFMSLAAAQITCLWKFTVHQPLYTKWRAEFPQPWQLSLQASLLEILSQMDNSVLESFVFLLEL